MISRKKNNWHKEISDFLRTATTQNQWTTKPPQSSSTTVSLEKAIPIIQYELWGLLHADWETLNRLKIIKLILLNNHKLFMEMPIALVVIWRMV